LRLNSAPQGQDYSIGWSDGENQAQSDWNSNLFSMSSGGHNHCPDGHTNLYCQGWNAGYADEWNRSIQANPNTQPSNTGQNWKGICNQIQPLLVESCSQLVNPDGSLTVPDGEKAHTCISNGIALGLGGLILSGGSVTNLPLIIGGLKILSTQTGCDGVVNWDNLNLDQLNLLRSIFH